MQARADDGAVMSDTTSGMSSVIHQLLEKRMTAGRTTGIASVLTLKGVVETFQQRVGRGKRTG